MASPPYAHSQGRLFNYLVALEPHRVAVKRWPKDKTTLRNRARVLEKSWRD